MNLMEESFQNNEAKKKKRTSTIILVAIFIVLIAIILIIVYLAYAKKSQIKLYLDGKQNQKVLDLLLIKEDGTVNAPIKEIAEYLGYESFNGEYADKSEEISKCYVQSKTNEEICNLELGSKKLYKLDLSNSNQNYEYYYTKNAVFSNNGVLYGDSEIIENAFNVSFNYDKDKNTITILTMPYLIQAYSSKVLDYGYKEISDVFANKKTILKNMLVVKKDDKKMGVIGTDGKAILEAKYTDITYLPSIGDFLVDNDKKIGVMSDEGSTKIRLMYDSIELMDKDAGLYLVKKDNKYGVLDVRGNIKIDINNDEIGTDISKFERNDIKNKYILADNLIPARQDKSWGLYDKNGQLVVNFEFDSFGYVATNNRNALNLLVIPEYNVLVACKNKKYTLLNSYGKQLFAGPIADDIYMTIEGNEKKYTISANNNTYDAIEFLKSLGINTRESNNTNQKINQRNNVEGNKNEESQLDEQQNDE
ncbi:MAG: WG repeat-containing protein [Clostridia bacterium]|nr:WG repeat-containing protein [Clostridia bacterium]